MRWYLIVVLISISLIISVLKHLFMYLLAIWMPLKNAYQVLCPFLNWVLYFCCWVVWVPYVFWIVTPIRYVVWKYFIPFHRCLFIWLMVYFAEQKLLDWCSLTHLFLPSLSLFLVSNPKNSSPRSMSEGLLPVFSYRIFMVSDFKYKSFNLFFELIFVWCDIVVQLHSFACGCCFFQHHIWKGRFFSYCILLAPLLKIKWPSMHGIFFWILFCSTNLCVCFYANNVLLWLL